MQFAPIISDAWRAIKAATSGGPSGSSGTSGGGNQLTPDSFIQLLSAQLQAQTPDSAVDPNQMMTELVQFNTLQQVMQMNQELGAFLAAASGAKGTAPVSVR